MKTTKIVVSTLAISMAFVGQYVAAHSYTGERSDESSSSESSSHQSSSSEESCNPSVTGLFDFSWALAKTQFALPMHSETYTKEIKSILGCGTHQVDIGVIFSNPFTMTYVGCDQNFTVSCTQDTTNTLVFAFTCAFNGVSSPGVIANLIPVTHHWIAYSETDSHIMCIRCTGKRTPDWAVYAQPTTTLSTSDMCNVYEIAYTYESEVDMEAWCKLPCPNKPHACRHRGRHV